MPTQAVKYESLEVGNLLVDGMSFGGSKIGSVPGCAALFVKPGTKLLPLISGGGQGRTEYLEVVRRIFQQLFLFQTLWKI
jgi:cysteine sulfinate desulfinase/cysteine desulfurase-like protein